MSAALSFLVPWGQPHNNNDDAATMHRFSTGFIGVPPPTRVDARSNGPTAAAPAAPTRDDVMNAPTRDQTFPGSFQEVSAIHGEQREKLWAKFSNKHHDLYNSFGALRQYLIYGSLGGLGETDPAAKEKLERRLKALENIGILEQKIDEQASLIEQQKKDIRRRQENEDLYWLERERFKQKAIAEETWRRSLEMQNASQKRRLEAQQEKIRVLEAELEKCRIWREEHGKRLEFVFEKMWAKASLTGSTKAWKAETNRAQLVNALKGSQRQLAEERERMQTKIMELNEQLEQANKEISRLVCHIHSLAVRRCKRLRALVQPLALPPLEFSRECFSAWKRARGWIREELRLTLHRGELAWKESNERFLLAEVQRGQELTEFAWSEANLEAYKAEEQRRAFEAERRAWAAERASLFARHIHAVVTLTAQHEETMTSLVEQHKADTEAWSKKEKQLTDRKVFLEEVVEEGLAEENCRHGRAKYPVLPKSCGTVCVACRRRIVGQSELPNNRPKSAGSRSTPNLQQQSMVDTCVKELLAPGIVKLIGEHINGLDGAVDAIHAKSKHQKQGGWVDRPKEPNSASSSPYAVPPVRLTRTAAGNPLNARAALMRQN